MLPIVERIVTDPVLAQIVRESDGLTPLQTVGDTTSLPLHLIAAVSAAFVLVAGIGAYLRKRTHRR